MKLHVELTPEQYAAVERGEVVDLVGPLATVVITQKDSLLSLERPLRYVEQLGGYAKHNLEVPPGIPAIRAWIGREEVSDVSQDRGQEQERQGTAARG